MNQGARSVPDVSGVPCVHGAPLLIMSSATDGVRWHADCGVLGVCCPVTWEQQDVGSKVNRKWPPGRHLHREVLVSLPRIRVQRDSSKRWKKTRNFVSLFIFKTETTYRCRHFLDINGFLKFGGFTHFCHCHCHHNHSLPVQGRASQINLKTIRASLF